MNNRRALLAVLMIPFFALIILLSPPVPAPIIDPGDGDEGGTACADSDSTCWHMAQGISGVVKDLVFRHSTPQDEMVAITLDGVYRSVEGRVFTPFAEPPPGTLTSVAWRPPYELYVGSSAGLFRQQVPYEINPWFVEVFQNVNISYVASPSAGTAGPVYVNVTSPPNKRGLWRSIDGATGWVRVLPDVEVRSVVVPFGCNTATDPQASNRVYAATRCPTCTAPNLGVLWVSSNAGLAGTWTSLPFPTNDVKDLAVVCNGAPGVSQRWMFAANGTTAGASVYRSLPTETELGLNFEPWSNGIPLGGANTFRGTNGVEGDWGVLVGTGTGLYRLPYNPENRWVAFPMRGLQSPIINRWGMTYYVLDVATTAGVYFYFGNPPN